MQTGVSCYCEGPRSPVALTRGWPPVGPREPWGRLSSDDNTWPCYVYITLMLTCNFSAVAAWQHSLCVCTEVAMCEFVKYMQVCVLVSAKKSVSCHAKRQHMHAPSCNCTAHAPTHTHTSIHEHTPAVTHHLPQELCPELALSLRMETLLCVNFLILINQSDIQVVTIDYSVFQFLIWWIHCNLKQYFF